MKLININPSKSQTHKVKDSAIRAQVWTACYAHLPVTFENPQQVEKACKLEAVKFTDGSQAYRLKVPVFGTYYCTDWYK
mgnify:CR=1 FL=1